MRAKNKEPKKRNDPKNSPAIKPNMNTAEYSSKIEKSKGRQTTALELLKRRSKKK